MIAVVMPTAVLAHGRPFALPEESQGFTSETLEAVLRAANEDLATIVPNVRFFVASNSGHDINQDQPELVTEAVRQALLEVCHPDTWDALVSCCAPWCEWPPHLPMIAHARGRARHRRDGDPGHRNRGSARLH